MMFWSVVLVYLACHSVYGKEPQCLTPKAKGEEVVQEAIDQIKNSNIFPDDKKFLFRIAFVESKFGNDSKTFRDGYCGGIWQVDEKTFEETKRTHTPKQKEILDNIKDNFCVDWTKIAWKDLKNPFFSALAARILLARVKEAIPDDVCHQAIYWKRYYNTGAGKGTPEKFMRDLQQAGMLDE